MSTGTTPAVRLALPRTAHQASSWVDDNWAGWLQAGLRILLIVVIAVVLRQMHEQVTSVYHRDGSAHSIEAAALRQQPDDVFTGRSLSSAQQYAVYVCRGFSRLRGEKHNSRIRADSPKALRPTPC